MATEQDVLQEKVDKMKAIGLLNNIHNLSPPISKSNELDNSVAIIDSLKVTPRLVEIFIEIRGLMYLPEEKKYIQVAHPIMNINGAFRFVKILKHISEEVEWSNFKEEEIDARIMGYFRINYPRFTFWHKDYELNPSDFGYVESTMMAFIDASFHKSKSSKFLNSVVKTYSEDLIDRTIGGGNQQGSNKESFLSKLNPFHTKK